MASNKLDQDQRAVNEILASKGYYTFKVDEFEKDTHAKKLLALYKNRKNKPLGDINFGFYIYNELKHKNRSIMVDMNKESEIIAVRELFKLTNNALIQKIIDPYYYAYCDQNPEDGEFDFGTEIQLKIDSWVKYCKQIDLCYLQYKQDKELWSKSAKDKRDYKQYWKDLAQKELFKNNENVKSYIEFLDSGYRLNQKVRLKAKYLVSLEFPNINYEIAKKIVETSSLLR